LAITRSTKESRFDIVSTPFEASHTLTWLPFHASGELKEGRESRNQSETHALYHLIQLIQSGCPSKLVGFADWVMRKTTIS